MVQVFVRLILNTIDNGIIFYGLNNSNNFVSNIYTASNTNNSIKYTSIPFNSALAANSFVPRSVDYFRILLGVFSNVKNNVNRCCSCRGDPGSRS